MVDESRLLSVDLHWRILPRYFASAFDYEDVWQSLESTAFWGRTIPVLRPELLLLLLCAHGAKHAFGRIGWICDIASCLVAFPNLRWPEVLAASARAGTMRELSVGVEAGRGSAWDTAATNPAWRSRGGQTCQLRANPCAGGRAESRP